MNTSTHSTDSSIDDYRSRGGPVEPALDLPPLNMLDYVAPESERPRNPTVSPGSAKGRSSCWSAPLSFSLMYLMTVVIMLWEGTCITLGLPIIYVLGLITKPWPFPSLKRIKSRLFRILNIENKILKGGKLKTRHPLLRKLTLEINNVNYLKKGLLGGPAFSKRRLRRMARERRWIVSNITESKLKPMAFPLRFFQGLPGVEVDLMGCTTWALLDSGCRFNLISNIKLREIENKGLRLKKFHTQVRLAAHNGSDLQIDTKGVILPVTVVTSEGQPVTVELPFLVELCSDKDRLMIIGSDSIKDKKLILDMANGQLYGRLTDHGPLPPLVEDQYYSVLVNKPTRQNPSTINCIIPCLHRYSGPIKLGSLKCTACHRLHAPEVRCEWVESRSNQIDSVLSHSVLGMESGIDLPEELTCVRGTFQLHGINTPLVTNVPLFTASIPLRQENRPVSEHCQRHDQPLDTSGEPIPVVLHDSSFSGFKGKMLSSQPGLWTEILTGDLVSPLTYAKEGPGRRMGRGFVDVAPKDLYCAHLSDENDINSLEPCVITHSPDGADVYSSGVINNYPNTFIGSPGPTTGTGSAPGNNFMCLTHNSTLAVQSGPENAETNRIPSADVFPRVDGSVGVHSDAPIISPADVLSRVDDSVGMHSDALILSGSGGGNAGLVTITPLANFNPDLIILFTTRDECLLCNLGCHCLETIHFLLPSYKKVDTNQFLNPFTYVTFKDSKPDISEVYDLNDDLKDLIKIISTHKYLKIQVGTSTLGPIGKEVTDFLGYIFTKTWHSQNPVTLLVGPKIDTVNVGVTPPSECMKEVVKHQELLTSTVGLPDETFQPFGIQVASKATNYDKDFKQMSDNSHPCITIFLKALFEVFSPAISKSADDIGQFTSPEFEFDISLQSESAPLPQQVPYPTTWNIKQACSRIVDIWCRSGIAERSPVRTHASRLLCVKKAVSTSDTMRICKRLLEEEKIVVEAPQSQNLFRVDVSKLTDSEVSKMYRITLDAVALNKILRPQLPIQQSTEVAMQDLSIFLGKGDKLDLTIQNLHKDTVQVPNEPTIPNEAIEHLESLINTLDDDDRLWFSSLDIRAAHQTLKCTTRASYLLNFISPSFTFFRFIRGAYGLQQISAVFNFSMISILEDLILKKLVELYADDCLIAVRGKRNHCRVILEIVRRFARNGIKLSINKCYFMVARVTFLGHIFSSEGITLTDSRVDAISRFEVPTSTKQIQAFVGLIIYIARFYPFLQVDLAPLHEAIAESNKNQVFVWGKAQEAAFKKVKKTVASGLRLNYIPSTKKLKLFTDSSSVGGGGVLFFENDDGEFCPVCFFSRKFSAHEARTFSALEAECAILIDTLRKVSYYIDNVPIDCYVDAKAIVWLLVSGRKSSNQRLSRMINRLSEFPVNYMINYAKPTVEGMIMADTLSRQFDRTDNLERLPINQLREIQPTQVHVSLQGKFTLDELVDVVDRGEGYHIDMDNIIAPKKDTTGLNNHLCFQDTDIDLADISAGKFRIHNNFVLCPELSKANIIARQLEDPTLSKIISKFKDRFANPIEMDSQIIDGYTLVQGTLLKVLDSEEPLTPLNSRLCVPDSLLDAVVGTHHIVYGHLGQKSLYKILSNQYHSPKLRLAVRRLVESCAFCALYQVQQIRKNPISGFRMAEGPMSIIAMDHFFMPKASHYKAILLCIDQFSLFSWAFACRDETARTVAAHLDQIFSWFGPAQMVKSDQGASLLKSKAVQEVLKKYGITNTSLSLPYAPFHNASCERAVKTYRALLRAESFANSKGWPRYLRRVNLIRNTIPRIYPNGMFISPFELFLGRKYPPILANPQALLESSDYLPQDRTLALEIKRAILKEVTQLKRQYIKEHNRKARPVPLEPGDFAVVKDMVPENNQTGRGKQKEAYAPVLYVVKGVNGTCCCLENIVTNTIHYTHVDYVKKYRSRQEYFDTLPESLRKRLGNSFMVDLDKDDRMLLLSKLKEAGFDTSFRVQKLPHAAPLSAGVTNAAPISDAQEREESTRDLSIPSTYQDGDREETVTTLSVKQPIIGTKNRTSTFGRIKQSLRKLARRSYK